MKDEVEMKMEVEVEVVEEGMRLRVEEAVELLTLL